MIPYVPPVSGRWNYLNMTGDGVSQANLAIGDAYFYNGDVNKWKKFVYGVLARSYGYLSNKATIAQIP
jgi:hypothetical protein